MYPTGISGAFRAEHLGFAQIVQIVPQRSGVSGTSLSEQWDNSLSENVLVNFEVRLQNDGRSHLLWHAFRLEAVLDSVSDIFYAGPT